jgi:uncharacterized peroxidase-related enzyme
MPWIATVHLDNADGDLRAAYDSIVSARGGVANVHCVQSLNPRALLAHLELYKAIIFQRSSLTRQARERIAVIVSAVNQCDYCIAHHGEALRRLGEDPLRVAALGSGTIPVGLSPAARMLLRWAQRAASAPSTCTEDDLSELRAYGFDDRAILDAALTVAYFSFVNRLVLTLGVELESDFEATCAPSLAGDEQPDRR